MEFVFGIQQLQLGSICKNENIVQRGLFSLSEAGFQAIELNGFMIRKTPLIARTLLKVSGMGIEKSQKLPWEKIIAEAQMKVISIHEDLGTLENDFAKVEEEITKYAPRYIVVTGMYNFSYDDEGEIGKLIVRLNRAGRNLKAQGISLLYHNHSAEFQSVDETTKAFDVLLEGLNPEWVNFEFDSYWATEAGADALAWMKKLGNRMKLYHVCDRGCRKKGPYITPIVKADAIELGEGSMNLPLLLKQAVAQNVDAVILEQHRNYFADDPIASAKRSAKYIKGIKKAE
ncbi:MAG: TIM barrel protein [Bacilli bacterium]|nr:TIM barrel protein [Bacilli bacterium]